MKITINKNNIFQLLQEGAWDDNLKNSVENSKLLNIASRENFKNNPLQYFLNPFIRGPLFHTGSEVGGLFGELLYKVLKNKNSKPIESMDQLKKELDTLLKDPDYKNSPWEKEVFALIKAMDKTDQSIKHIKSKYFMHWLLNPLVKGPLSTKLMHATREKLEQAMLKYSKQLNLSEKDKIEELRKIEHKQYLDNVSKSKNETQAK
ncbi:MAG: hypothetical protein WC136_08925 [Sphaerochaeta sp.]